MRIEKNYKKGRWIAAAALTLAGLSLAVVPGKAVKAATPWVVSASHRGGSADRHAIERALDRYGKVVLKSGQTYRLDASIHLHSNQTIVATGAKIYGNHCIARNVPEQAKHNRRYSSIKNVTIIGGTWLPKAKRGYPGRSVFILAHAKNLHFENMTIRANYSGHAIELVACKNAVVQGCNIKGVGRSSSSSPEEMVQIDLAGRSTAPFLPGYLQNGVTCHNIYVLNNYIKGNRAVCANFAKTQSRFRHRKHHNIVVKGNTLIGKNQGLVIYNTKHKVLKDNKIKNRGKTAKALVRSF